MKNERENMNTTAVKVVSKNEKVLPKSAFVREIKKNKVLFMMIAPAVLLVLIFSYIPMAGIIVAFKNYQFDLGIYGSPWVGFKNFEFFFKSGKAMLLTFNTIAYNISFRAVNLVFELSFAIIISELSGKYVKKAMQSVMILPFFISWVIVGGFVYSIFNYEYGLMNTVLKAINLTPVDVYSNAGNWPYILVGASAWKGVGYGMIVYLAAISGISPELYESAYLDGAGLFKRIWYITLPLLKPTVIILILLGLSSMLKGNFDMFYQLVGNNGQLFDATDVIDTFVFRSLVGTKNLGMSSAAGFYQQLMGFVIVMTINGTIRKVNPDYVIF